MQTSAIERTAKLTTVSRRNVGMYARGEYPQTCPQCTSDASRVTRTRETILGAKTVRDRVCNECGRKWVTLTPRG